MRAGSKGTWPCVRVTGGFPEEAMLEAQQDLFRQSGNEEENRKRGSNKLNMCKDPEAALRLPGRKWPKMEVDR